MLVDMNAEAVAAQAQRLGAQSVVADISSAKQRPRPRCRQRSRPSAASMAWSIAPASCVAKRSWAKNGPHALASFSQVINVNLIGSFNMLRLASAAIAETEADADGERGVIINTASAAAYDGEIGQAAYSASKGRSSA